MGIAPCPRRPSRRPLENGQSKSEPPTSVKLARYRCSTDAHTDAPADCTDAVASDELGQSFADAEEAATKGPTHSKQNGYSLARVLLSPVFILQQNIRKGKAILKQADLHIWQIGG